MEVGHLVVVMLFRVFGVGLRGYQHLFPRLRDIRGLRSVVNLLFLILSFETVITLEY